MCTVWTGPGHGVSGAGAGKVRSSLRCQRYDMLRPILLRVAVTFSIPKAPLAQIEAVNAIRTLIMHVLPLHRWKGTAIGKYMSCTSKWLTRQLLLCAIRAQ